MPFDPSQPFTVESEGATAVADPPAGGGGFDPSQPFTVEDPGSSSQPASRGFDPSKPFTVEAEPAPRLGLPRLAPPAAGPPTASAALPTAPASELPAIPKPSTATPPPAPTSNALLNAGRELVGGAASSTLGVAEGFERAAAGFNAATPASVDAFLDRQIASRQTALDTLGKLPDYQQDPGLAQRIGSEIKGFQAKRADHRLLSPGDAPGLGSRQLLSPEGQAARDASAAAANETADTLRDAKAAAGEFYGADPARRDTVPARVARTVGEAAPLLAASAVPGAGLAAGAGVAGLQAKANAYDEYLAEARARGESDEDARRNAQDYSDAAALRTVPEMAAFLGTGKVAAGVVSRLLSPSTPAAVRALVSAAAATTGNAAAGTANQLVEQAATGKPLAVDYSLERGVQDALFGGMHGLSETRQATRQPNLAPPARAAVPGAANAPRLAPPDNSARAAKALNLGPGEPAAPVQNGPRLAPPPREVPPPPGPPAAENAGVAPSTLDGPEAPAKRAPVPPVYAEGSAPGQRASAFLDVEGEALPSAARFAPDEEVPASLDHSPRVALPDGSTIVYDPETHQPSDFDTGDGKAAPVDQSLPQVETDGGIAGTPQGEEIRPSEEMASSPRVDSTAGDQARREYEASLRDEAHAGIEDAGGVELLKAVRAAGGLPTSDPVFNGELKNIREASAPVGQANRAGTFNLFRKSAPSLDELASALQAQGFEGVETPADLLGTLHERVASQRPVYGFGARAEAQSGMAGGEAYFRRQRATPPRTPEELRPQQERWFSALQRLSPDTALRLEVVHQDALESLWPGGSAPRTEDGGSVHAANLHDTIYLSADALRSNAPQVNRVNLLHEVAHSYERALPVAERQALRQQWKEEVASQRSPLHDDAGRLHPEVDPRAATDFSEWLAERVAWENEGHFAGRIDPQAAPQSAVARFVAGLRALVLRTWQAVRPDVAPSELSARFRDWLTKGGQVEQSAMDAMMPTGEPDAQFAQRQSLEEQGYREATPEERKRLGIPPAWTDVHIATDPNARRVAVGKDGKGRTQSRYSTAHTAEAHAQKFERLQQFQQALPDIMSRVRESLASGKGREEAAILRLIQRMGFRNGGDEETGGKVKAYGASNLRAEHVAFDGDTTHFDFTGKLGVRQQHSLTDPEITADLRQRAAKGGALFDTTSSKVLDYLKGSGAFKVHDLRTWNATDLAAREVENAPAPQTADEFWNQRDRIGDLAAKKLGDTRKIVLESYVNPAVFEPWKTALGITDENRPTKRAKASAERAGTTGNGRAADEANAGLLRDEQLRGRPAPGDQAAAALRPARRVAQTDPLPPEPSEPKAALRQTWRGLRGSVESRGAKDRITAGKDAAENRAGMVARQAANGVRLDFGTRKQRADPHSQASRDLAAMPFVIEAGGNRAEVAADLAKVKASTDPALAKKYAPVVQHALDNFARLDGLKANYEAIAAKQRAIERRHGIDSGEVKNYVTRKLDLPEHQRTLEPNLLGSLSSGTSMGSRYFAKGRDFAKLSDAIQEGYPPKSTDLADLLEHRVRTGQQLVQQAKLFAELRATKAPGDPAGRSIIGQLENHTTLSGKVEQRIPLGYDTVSAGGGKPLIVQRQYVGLFKALYGESDIRNAAPGRLLLKYAALAKHGTLVFDTFHAARMFAKELSYGYQAGYSKGLSLLEYSDKDLARAVAARDVTQAQADYARTHRAQADELLKAGLNVGRVADNLMGDAHGVLQKIPLVGKTADKGISIFNEWVFSKLSRGAMLQTALTNYRRNLSRFPELGQEGAARRTAKEMNEVFGNLASQGLFKSATLKDVVRTVLLAPQWTESQLRAEGRGLGQLVRIPVDAARGRFRVGTVAQGMASNVVALLLANQLANYLGRSKPTWQNPEQDHKLDAWLPGGAHGFFFSPFEIAAENVHALLHYHDQGKNLWEATAQLAGNKLGPVARGVAELATGKNYAGQPFATTTDRVRAAATDTLPFPLPVGSLVEKDPRNVAGSGPVTGVRSAADKVLAPLGYRVNRQPGSVARQVYQGAGFKVTPAPGARSQMYELARPFRAPVLAPGGHGVAQYTELRRALDNDDPQAVQDELRHLVASGKTLHQIGMALGLRQGGIAPEMFAGSQAAEQKMLRALTPDQRAIYDQAQREHQKNARRYQRIVAGERL